jgi:hypothetical protein
LAHLVLWRSVHAPKLGSASSASNG